MTPVKTSLDDHFEALKDPRRDHGRVYPLKTILILAVIGVLGGANDWVGIERYCRLKREWLETVLDVSMGIPSHDTFRRVFALLPGEAFQTCFMNWVNSLAGLKYGGVVAVDGKVMRGSHDQRHGQDMIELVSAWSTASGLVLAQRTVDEGSNEIAKVPELLAQLMLKGCSVTVDAANCQTANTRTVIERWGDYVFALKENQPWLHEQVNKAFESETNGLMTQVRHETWTTQEKAHGRIETRTYTLLTEPEYIDSFNPDGRWWHLGSVACVQRTRKTRDKVQTSVHYFISSLTSDVRRFAQAVRDHWSVENQLHWQLDITFNEDRARARVGFQPENFSLLRRFALNLLRAETSVKDSLQGKRMRVSLDNDYMLKVLAAAATLN